MEVKTKRTQLFEQLSNLRDDLGTLRYILGNRKSPLANLTVETFLSSFRDYPQKVAALLEDISRQYGKETVSEFAKKAIREE